MELSLSAAAKATGRSKSTIGRAIKIQAILEGASEASLARAPQVAAAAGGRR